MWGWEERGSDAKAGHACPSPQGSQCLKREDGGLYAKANCNTHPRYLDKRPMHSIGICTFSLRLRPNKVKVASSPLGQSGLQSPRPTCPRSGWLRSSPTINNSENQCLCSQMAVQLISSVNRPDCQQRERMRERMTTPTRNPTTPRNQEPGRTIHAIPESQGRLVLLCPGWSTTLSADGSRSTMLFIILPCTATAGLLSAAPGVPPTRIFTVLCSPECLHNCGKERCLKLVFFFELKTGRTHWHAQAE